MGTCPYCHNIIADHLTSCPNCGMSWGDGEQSPQEPVVEDIPLEEHEFDGAPPPEPEPTPEPVKEQPQPPEQPAQPPEPQPVKQAPPQETQPAPRKPMKTCLGCGQLIDIQYVVCPYCQRPTAAQPQPPAQQPVQPQPQPATEKPVEQRTCLGCGRHIRADYTICPHCGRLSGPAPAPAPVIVAPPPPRPVKVSAGGMAAAIIGGILALIGSFMLYFTSTGGASTTAGVTDLTGDYVYGWLIPGFGLLALALASLAFALKNNAAATIASVMGLLAFVFALILPLHIASDAGVPIIDAFYRSDIIFTGTTMTTIYLGGFLAMIGGLIAMGGAGALANSIKKARQSQQYPPQRPGYY